MSDTTPATSWTKSEGEWAGSMPVDIADASGNLLIDSSSNNVTDDSTVFTPIAATAWTVNDGS